MPATPELLAKVAALPPATDEPGRRRAAARAADPQFSLRRLLRPLRLAFALGIALIGLDAVLQLVLPALIRTGIDRGVGRAPLRGAAGRLGGRARRCCWSTGLVSAAGQRLTGRTGERLLYTLRVKTFAHLQRLGLDYYERELGGRIMTRMTTDVDALSNFLQTGLATALISVLTLVGVLVALLLLDAAAVAGAGGDAAGAVRRPRWRSAGWRCRPTSRPASGSARSTPSSRRTWPASGWRRCSAASSTTPGPFLGAASDYRDSRLRAQTYIAAYFPFVQFLADLAGALVLGLRRRTGCAHGTPHAPAR